ncbi:MAG: phosphatidylglycerophosphatase, partial [Acidimicrobiaceae bacterium]|nr:phosphatidylglycerophosphatase [Acidimicrobiaceae bacterium]
MARRVAAFDFDGTLAKGDSLLPFLVRVRGRRAVGTVLAAQGPSIAMALAGVADGGAGGGGSRDRAKAALVGRLLRGLPADAVGREGEAFARRLLERRMRPEMSE